MATKPIPINDLDQDTMSGADAYRVDTGRGVLSIRPRKNASGVYWYAFKRIRRKLYKVYVGKQGDVTREAILQAVDDLARKSGAWLGKKQRNIG